MKNTHAKMKDQISKLYSDSDMYQYILTKPSWINDKYYFSNLNKAKPIEFKKKDQLEIEEE